MSYLLQFRAVALQTCRTALVLLPLLLMLHTQLLNTHTEEMRWTQLIKVDLLNTACTSKQSPAEPVGLLVLVRTGREPALTGGPGVSMGLHPPDMSALVNGAPSGQAPQPTSSPRSWR